MTPGGQSGRLSILQAAAIDDTEMGASALRMLVALGTYADPEGWCWPKQRVLADRLGICQQAVSKAIREVVRLGYVEAHDQFDPNTGARVSSRYRIVLDFQLPPERRRTPQPDVVGSQLQVVGPTTPEVVGPTTPEVVAPTTPEVVASKEERPRKNDPKERPTPEPARPIERELFDYYRRRIFPTARVFKPAKIRARLKTFTAEELRTGIDKFAADWWWMENNATRGADWFFDSDKRSEQFLNMVPRTERPSSHERNGAPSRAHQPGGQAGPTQPKPPAANVRTYEIRRATPDA
jgi:hypothetical protein